MSWKARPLSSPPSARPLSNEREAGAAQGALDLGGDEVRLVDGGGQRRRRSTLAAPFGRGRGPRLRGGGRPGARAMTAVGGPTTPGGRAVVAGEGHGPRARVVAGKGDESRRGRRPGSRRWPGRGRPPHRRSAAASGRGASSRTSRSWTGLTSWYSSTNRCAAALLGEGQRRSVPGSAGGRRAATRSSKSTAPASASAAGRRAQNRAAGSATERLQIARRSAALAARHGLERRCSPRPAPAESRPPAGRPARSRWRLVEHRGSRAASRPAPGNGAQQLQPEARER